MARLATTLLDCQCRAVRLQGVLQGLDYLLNEHPLDQGVAGNAIHAIAYEAQELAGRLAGELDEIELSGRNP